MRKGTKRKAASSKQEEKEEESKVSSSNNKPAPKAKRAKTPKPEPEYFKDKRNLEDLWEAAFLVGTEWDQLDSVYQYNWNFSNLEDAFKQGGKLHGKKVHWTYIKPPSRKIGITSVQSAAEVVVPMKEMKMDWVPYIPLENRDSQVGRLKSQMYILHCTQRRAALKHLEEDHIKKYTYCLPYFKNPLKEDELEQSNEVIINFPAEPRPVICEFDWELDELDEFTNKLIEADELDNDQKDAFKEFVKDIVRKAKKNIREKREEREEKLEKMREEKEQAYQNVRFYKFYPVQTPDTPDVSNVKASFINRYYGKAHEVL
ncbi:hypothetical protein CCACVL1_19457 [Corchorus capsularis]|uniref:Uncharacterized protein n=1 Tax=Corchorus capsularis TaxID=210143 RepID=A0A1R3HGT9_COCAP|nr:hypothetical protein CCACVL1_19457 [Corchorus capsularis]